MNPDKTAGIVMSPDGGSAAEQIVAQVTRAATHGILSPGTRLPAVRALAEELGLAVNTVAKAYRRLEAEGIVETHGRNGTLIASPPDGADAVTGAARALVDRARDAGLGLDEAIGVLRRVWG